MFAYLDAATGSMIAAAFAGGIAGIAVLFRMYSYRILGVFSKKYRRKAEMNQGDLLGVDIDPETGLPTDPEAAAEVLSGNQGDASVKP
ncbi:MAG: hypothetical protein ABI239_12865 [Aquihabitans sp.]